MSNEILIRGLNDDLAAELGTVIRYLHQAAQCYGLLTVELRELLVKEAQDELGHAAYLMDVMSEVGLAKGRSPTTPENLQRVVDKAAQVLAGATRQRKEQCSAAS